MNGNLSTSQFSTGAIPETTKFDGPGAPASSGSENKFAANTGTPIAKPGYTG